MKPKSITVAEFYKLLKDYMPVSASRRPFPPERLKLIEDARKRLMSWREIAEYFGRLGWGEYTGNQLKSIKAREDNHKKRLALLKKNEKRGG
jgi:hypothetical protein